MPGKTLNQYLLGLALLLLSAGFSTECRAQDTSEEPTQVPALRDLNGYFPFSVPIELEAWEKRKTQLHTHLRVSLGLWPYPKRTPLNAVIHGLIDQGDYTIEKVYFESLPGFFVTGNLYKPKRIDGRIPGIISPHGHFPNGRFGEQSDEAIKNDIESGAETFHSNARNKIQTRCANLAKMGCVVFDYDMIGYADSQQISFEVAHRFSKQSPGSNGPNRWGLFSPQAELRLQNVMGLQAWNSIRALDFLETLPEVDPKRIGVTGASGGGTQTFIVCALDDRPAAAFPAVMVSTAMQGGCTCENCCYLRVGTGNVELAAMFAPKPMGLTAANDWTKEMSSKGFPELQQLYALYDKQDNVELNSRIEFGHNYNQVSREAMYRWFKKHLGFAGEPVETEIEFLKPDRITVFDEQHPRPPGGTHFEQNFLVGLDSPKSKLADWGIELRVSSLLEDPVFRSSIESKYGTTETRTLFRLVHSNMGSLAEEFKSLWQASGNRPVEQADYVSSFVDVVMNAAESSNGDPESVTTNEVDLGFDGFEAIQRDFGTTNRMPNSSVRELSHGETPRILLISEEGFGVFDRDNRLRSLVEACLGSMSVSVFNNGWIQESDKKQTRRVNNPRESLAYTVGYNAPQLARRANAWLIATSITTIPETRSENSLYVVSLDGASIEVALNARELSERAEIAGLVINTHGFRFNEISDIRDPNLLPGAVKYGDLPALLALAAPEPLLLIGEDQTTVRSVVTAYEESGHPENLTLVKTISKDETEQEIVLNWIKERNAKKANVRD